MRRLLAVLAVALVGIAGCSEDPPAEQKRPDTFADSTLPACPRSTGMPSDDSRLARLDSLSCMDGSGATVAVGAPTGKPQVINLWGSWCAPCGVEMPVLVAFSAAAAGRVTVLGVNTEDGAERALAAADEVSVNFPNVYDRDGTVRRALGRNGLPVTVFVTADGTVARVHTGPLDAVSLRREVADALGVSVR